MNGISVIICAYTEERWEEIVAAVESVKQQTLKPDEIIVVIDHNPKLLERVEKCLSSVIIVENTEAQGASGSRNSGIAVAKGRIIACLDDDAVAIQDWLMILYEAFADPKVLGVGGDIRPLWKEDKPVWFPEEFYWVIGCTYRGMPQTTTTIRNLIGANMAVRREVFDTVGGFRTEIGRIGTWPIGCEETELCIRAQQHWPDKVFLYQPQARVSQYVPIKRTKWRYFYTRCFAEGLSKAAVTRYVGVKDSLATESNYVRRTLPRGVVHGLTDALFHRDLSGFARSTAIVTGLAVTIVGYLVASISLQLTALRSAKTASAFSQRSSKISPPIEV